MGAAGSDVGKAIKQLTPGILAQKREVDKLEDLCGDDAKLAKLAKAVASSHADFLKAARALLDAAS